MRLAFTIFLWVMAAGQFVSCGTEVSKRPGVAAFNFVYGVLFVLGLLFVGVGH